MLQGAGLGYWPDPADPRDKNIELLGLATTPPAAHSNEHRLIGIPNQLGTNSCVGQAVRQALGIEAWRKHGASPTVASALALYFNSRAEHGLESFDIGTFLRTCMRGLVKLGAAAESAWPFNSSNVNVRPTWHAYQTGFDARGPHRYYRITSTEDARLDEIRRAVAYGHPVVFGTPVATTFLSDVGSAVIDRPSAEVVGGHAMCIVGYQNELFRVANSWGVRWRDGGLGWLTSAYMAWEKTSDIWVLALS